MQHKFKPDKPVEHAAQGKTIESTLPGSQEVLETFGGEYGGDERTRVQRIKDKYRQGETDVPVWTSAERDFFSDDLSQAFQTHPDASDEYTLGQVGSLLEKEGGRGARHHSSAEGGDQPAAVKNIGQCRQLLRALQTELGPSERGRSGSGSDAPAPERRVPRGLNMPRPYPSEQDRQAGHTHAFNIADQSQESAHKGGVHRFRAAGQLPDYDQLDTSGKDADTSYEMKF